MVDITPETIGNYWSGFSMSGFEQMAGWIIKIAIGLILLGVLYFFYYYTTFKTKVTYYSMQGDPDNIDTWVLSRPKLDKAKIVQKKGISHFSLLWARKKIKEVPYKYIYPDGIYLLRLSKNEFQPIKRPQMTNPHGIIIEPIDTDLEMWANLQYEDVRKRFINDDATRRQMLMTAGILVGLIILTGVVIWLNVAYNSSALEKTDKIVNALNQVGTRIGIN